MTLIELLVAMGIIAVVAIMCVSAFSMMLGSEMRETNTRLASERAQERIAMGDAPTTTAAFAISLGGFTIDSEAATYSEAVGSGEAIAGEDGRIDISGKRSYTVLKGTEAEPLFFHISVGDGAVASDGDINTGTAGRLIDLNIPFSGVYMLEAWGACGGGSGGNTADSSFTPGFQGAYARSYVRLTAGDTLKLLAGGRGGNGSGGGGSFITKSDYTPLCIAGGGGGRGGPGPGPGIGVTNNPRPGNYGQATTEGGQTWYNPSATRVHGIEGKGGNNGITNGQAGGGGGLLTDGVSANDPYKSNTAKGGEAFITGGKGGIHDSDPQNLTYPLGPGGLGGGGGAYTISSIEFRGGGGGGYSGGQGGSYYTSTDASYT
jgi:type II secretory pathway pseudopilin PulG